MAGKVNSKQICVYKTTKALIEFMDDTRYDNEPLAWPHTAMSRIRINMKDYSKGTGDRAVDTFYNLSPEEFFRLYAAVQKARSQAIADKRRCDKSFVAISETMECIEKLRITDADTSVIDSIIAQFVHSRNELFKESGEKLATAFKVFREKFGEAYDACESRGKSGVEDVRAAVEEASKAHEIYGDLKILNFEKYTNPENEAERRITTIKVTYAPSMNLPYIINIGNGWGQPFITKQKGSILKEGTARIVDTVNICIGEKHIFPMLKKVDIFLQAMTAHGLERYFEEVTNPSLYREPD